MKVLKYETGISSPKTTLKWKSLEMGQSSEECITKINAQIEKMQGMEGGLRMTLEGHEPFPIKIAEVYIDDYKNGVQEFTYVFVSDSKIG